MAMSVEATANDRAIQHVQGCKQVRYAMTHIVVGHRSARPAFHRHSRLSPIQRLNLGLLIHAPHQRFIRRIQVQSPDVGERFDKLRVAGAFECTRTWCGCKPWASQIWAAVIGWTPNFAARICVLQCVSSAGVVWSAAFLIALTNWGSGRWGLSPRDASRFRAEGSPFANRWEQPLWARRPIRERTATSCGVVGARTHASSVYRCSSVRGNAGAGFDMPLP